MVTKSKKTRARWDSEVERKLIDIWADIPEELENKGEGTAAAQFFLVYEEMVEQAQLRQMQHEKECKRMLWPFKLKWREQTIC